MDLTTQAHLASGSLALALGIAALARDPARARSRLFAALALSLALWHLAAAMRHEHLPGREAWRCAAYVGGAAAGPIALHLSLVLSGRRRPRLLAVAYALAACGVAGAMLLRGHSGWMRLVALAVPLAFSLCLAAATLRAHGLSAEGRADRPSLRLVMMLGAVAAIIGLTDLVPRDGGIPAMGSLALMPFLFALATIGLQRRYVEIDHVVARTAALGLTAAAAGAFLQASVELLGGSPLTYFLACLVVVAAAGPLVTSILAGTRALLDPGAGETARILSLASQEMARAEDAPAALRAIESLAPRLPGQARIQLELGSDAPPAASALVLLMLQDRAPITRRLLEIDAREAPLPARRDLAAAALGELAALGLEIVVPLLREGRYAGIIGLGGGQPERYVGGASGAALVALGHQALATLERIEAVERARRQETLAIVGEMAASLAHDVRNPLGAIRGAAQVLAEARNPAQEREMLGVIDAETERLGRVLGDFLEWARPRPARRERLDLAALTTRVASHVQLATKGARVQLDCDESAVVHGDEDLLTRALGNLIRNAREAAGPDGDVRLRVEAGATGQVVIRVQDDGPGLPARVRERLFEPFVTTKDGGTGLGLPLVLRAAQEHGGSVSASDLAPRGTEFTFVLPALQPRHDGA